MRLFLLFVSALSAAAQPCDRIFETPPRYLSGTVRDVVALDADSDTRPDLVVARDAEGGEAPGLLLLSNRATGFAAGARVPLPGNALRLWLQDRDIIAMGASFLATIQAKTDGTFATIITTVSGDALPMFPAAFGDFNGDGRGDVAVAVTRGNSTGFLRVFRRLSNGTFSEPVAQQTLTRELFGLAAGDVDGDGRLDLAYTDRVHGGWLAGKGDGTFGAQQTLGATTGRRVAAGDVDGDGRADVLAGSLLFLTTRSLAAQAGFGGLSVKTIADVTGDGKLDVLSGPYVFRGNGDGTFAQIPGGPPGFVGYHAVADFDRDGRLDVASSGEGVVIRFGREGGGLTGGSVVTGSFNTVLPYAADFNGDGRDDLVTNPGGRIYMADAGGTLQLPFKASGTISTAIGDFNGDGYDDLLLFESSPRVALGDASASFTTFVPAGTFSVGLTPEAVTADLNGDGKLDVAVLTDGVTRLIGDGTGRFTVGTTTPLPIAADRLAVADFNRDGVPDIAVMAVLEPLYVIDGKAPSTAVQAADVSALGLAVADVDGDALPDLVTVDAPSYTLVVFPGNGNLTFRGARAVARFGNDTRPDVAAADFSGDGRTDFFVTYTSEEGRAQYLVQQNDGSFVREQTLFTEDWTGAGHGDFDGDGHRDVVFSAGISANPGAMYLHLSRCREALRIAPPRVRLGASGRTLAFEGPPDAAGNVTFFRDGVAFAVAPVVNGRASVTPALADGTYTFTAVYWGHERWSRAETPPVVHTLTDAPPRRRTTRH